MQEEAAVAQADDAHPRPQLHAVEPQRLLGNPERVVQLAEHRRQLDFHHKTPRTPSGTRSRSPAVLACLVANSRAPNRLDHGTPPALVCRPWHTIPSHAARIRSAWAVTPSPTLPAIVLWRSSIGIRPPMHIAVGPPPCPGAITTRCCPAFPRSLKMPFAAPARALERIRWWRSHTATAVTGANRRFSARTSPAMATSSRRSTTPATRWPR